MADAVKSPGSPILEQSQAVPEAEAAALLAKGATLGICAWR